MSEVPVYRIATVLDFLIIPPERREVALHEFNAWMAMREAIAVALGDLVKLPDVFEWIDDDLAQVSLGMTTTEGERIFEPRPVAKIKPRP